MDYKTAYKMVTKDELKEQLSNLMEILKTLDMDNISNLKDLRNAASDITEEATDLISILKNERR